MRITSVHILNQTVDNKPNKAPTIGVSKPEAMSDSFVSQNSDTVSFGGIFDFFKKKNTGTPEEQVSSGQISNEIEDNNYIENDNELNKFAKKLYDLTRADRNKNLSLEEKEEKLKEVVQMLESPQFIPANFSKEYMHMDTEQTLEKIINSAAEEYKPYIILETFGNSDSKIQKPLHLNSYSPESVLDTCLKNPEKYMNKTLDYLKYQERFSNDGLVTALTGRFLYERTPDFMELLIKNNNLTGEEISIDPHSNDYVPLALWYTLRTNNIFESPFPPAKTWYLSSQTSHFEKITKEIKEDTTHEQLLKTVDELFNDYKIDSSHSQLLHEVLGIIFSNMKDPKLGKDWEKLLLEKVIIQPDEGKGISEDESKKINFEIIQAYKESFKNYSLELLNKILRKSNIPVEDANLSTSEKVKIMFERLENNCMSEDIDSLRILLRNPQFKNILFNIAKSSDDNYKRVLNLYKNYFYAGGKVNFSGMSYALAKLYKDAGLTPASEDIFGNNFYDATKNFEDENGNRFFSIASLSPEIIKREFGDPNTYYGTSQLFQYLEKIKTPDKMLDEYENILKMQKQYSSSHIYCEDSLYMKFMNSVNVKFTKSYTCSDFAKYLNKLKSQSLEYSNSELSEYLSTMMDNSSYSHKYKDTLLIKIAFVLLSYEEQGKALEIMAPYGVSQLPLKLLCAKTAAKLGLDLYLADHAELKDGICTMGDFRKLIGGGESSPHMLVPDIYNVEVNDDKETLIDILIGINCNNDLDKAYKQSMLNILAEYARRISWNHCDKFGNNYLMKAIWAEDYQMIKFLKHANIDITQRNQFGQNTIDLIEQSSPEIQKLLEGMKAQSKELIDLVTKGSVSGAELLLKSKYININSLENSWSKNTPLHIAAKNDDVDMAEMLIKHSDIDVDAKTYNNDTFATIVAAHKNVRMVREVLAKIPPDKINLNGIYKNSSGEFSIYSKAVSLEQYSRNKYENRAKFFEELLKLKGADPNISSENLPPVAFTLVDEPNVELFQILVNSGKLDVHKTYNGKTLQEYINAKRWVRETESIRKSLLEALSKAVDLSAISSFKQKIEMNGVLTLDDISQFLKYPNLNGIISQNLSDSNEKISHLLCDIEMTPQNTVQVLNLARKMINSDKKAFTYPDIFGQSAINKVLLAENEVLLEYILKNSQLSGSDIESLSEHAHLVNNPKINTLITKQIMNGGFDDN